MTLQFRIDEIQSVSEKIISTFPLNKIFCFEGDLGAGKTTLIESICQSLGSKDDLSSPTFSIINEYASPVGALYHMDWYRLSSIDEAIHIGIEDYLFSGNYCFIEWPEKAVELIPKPYIKISIVSLTAEMRELSVVNVE